jgi:cysteine desulfurase family protein (TIGR01976 family)
MPKDQLMHAFPTDWVRSQFPSLELSVAGRPAIFLDAPGGTQVPIAVTRAVRDYYRQNNSNVGGRFVTSQNTAEIVHETRVALAEFIHANRPEEIVFGQNMTSLTFALSRALAKTWAPGSEIIVTSLDHDANISPWKLAAADRGCTVRTWEMRTEDCTLQLEDLRSLISERTSLIAVTLASNAVGSHVNVARVVELARGTGAKVFVDAVHFAPHGRIDVQALGCDFLACSAYKFFGPHIGVLWGKYQWLDELEAYKVRPSSATPPEKWETGTQSFESIAGTSGALDYLKETGYKANGSSGITGAMEAIREYESHLSLRFLHGLHDLKRATIFGLSDPNEIRHRTPTFAICLEGIHPDEAAEKLAHRGIFVWSGNFYAVDLVDRLGLADSGGVVRLGFTHYHTIDEVDRTLDALATL